MNVDLKKIKKKYGEGMAKFCREAFPTILEHDGVLFKILIDNFEYNHDLYNDIVENDITGDFKEYINNLFGEDKIEKVDAKKTPKELLSDAMKGKGM